MMGADGPLRRSVGQDPGGAPTPPGSVFHARLRTRRGCIFSTWDRRTNGRPPISIRESLPSRIHRQIVTTLTCATAAASTSVIRSFGSYAGFFTTPSV